MVRDAAIAGTLGLFLVQRAMAVMDVGDAHVCATIGDTPKCWGANRWGQLGRGDTNNTGDELNEMGDNLVAVDLGTGAIVSDWALGALHTCALLESGDVKCFGQNDNGQLGLGDTMPRGQSADELGDALPAVDFGTGLTATAIACGCEHTCALLDDGSVKCFGYNNYGQLGQGTTDNVGDDPGEMGDALSAVPLGDNAVVAIAAGCDFTCVIVDDGTVMCWGRNTWGQLGTGDTEDLLDEANEQLVAVDLETSFVTAIAAGEGHICALTDDSSVKCWGHNNNGQLGLGDNVDRGDTAASLGANLPAVAFGAGDVPSAIDCGSFFTCALLDDGSLKCFGENGYGELGIGSTTDVGALPTDMGANLTAVGLYETATEFASGGSSTCAVVSDDSVKCWGRGNSGQLGQGDDLNIGDFPGVLGEVAPVDLGTDSLSSTAAPTPASPVTSASSAVPTAVPTATPTEMSRQASRTESPTTTETGSPTTSETGSPTSGVENSPSFPSDSFSSVPTASPTVTVREFFRTSAPTVVDGLTLAPGATPVPVTPEPSATDVDGGGTNSASAHYAGGFLATLVLGAAGLLGLSFL